MCAYILPAQRRVEPENRHERLICIVPMVGAGTYDDPRRPMFVPNPIAKNAAALERESKREGIIAYAYQESGDGRSALVEFVATTRSAFKEILESKLGRCEDVSKGRWEEERDHDGIQAAEKRF